jgi:hypothetical protein
MNNYDSSRSHPSAFAFFAFSTNRSTPALRSREKPTKGSSTGSSATLADAEWWMKGAAFLSSGTLPGSGFAFDP